VASKFIQAAGGIVVRGGARPLFAVVQRSKDDKWVLPRGKLKRDENPVIGARREVVEETGHRVEVNEFLGAITYRAGGRPKVVQFWQMQAEEEASHELMADIVAVEWLPLKAAVRRLSYPLEKLFLRNVGRRAAKQRHGRKVPRKLTPKSAKQKSEKKANRKRNKKANKKANKRTGNKASKARRKGQGNNKAKTRRKRDNRRKSKNKGKNKKRR
jgi:8-oxo-dGTP diphosphatase